NAEGVGRHIRGKTRRDHPDVLADAPCTRRCGRDPDEAVKTKARGLILDRPRTHLLELTRLDVRRHPRQNRLPAATTVTQSLVLAERVHLPSRRLRPDEDLN